MHDVDKPCKTVLSEQPCQFDTFPDGVFYTSQQPINSSASGGK